MKTFCNWCIFISCWYIIILNVSLSAAHFRVCGRTNHNGSTGELYPHDGVIPSGQSCTWHIYPESYNMPEVFIIAEEFNFYEDDSFRINKHDGALLFGPFKGKKDKFSILSGYLALDAIVHTAALPSTPRKFKTHFTAKACYYLIEDEAGTISSPLYKDTNRKYNITCTWQFRKFKEMPIPRVVIFKSFQLTNSTLIVEGSESQDGAYTGAKLPPNISVRGNTEFVLHLNTSVPGETFSFNYEIKGHEDNLKIKLQDMLKSTPLTLQDLSTSVFSNTSTAISTSLPKITQDLQKMKTPTSIVNENKPRMQLCGKDSLIGKTGTFSPYDDSISAGENCYWNINIEDDGMKIQEIHIFVEKFLLADSDKFSLITDDDKVVGLYSGEKGPFNINIRSRRISVKLEISSEQPSLKRKFKANYTVQTCSAVCDNGHCMHPDWLCNGINDCGDNTDEKYCEIHSVSSSVAPNVITETGACTFHCDNGKCMNSAWRCNNIDECGDNSDERNCKGNRIFVSSGGMTKKIIHGVSSLSMGLAVPGAFVFGIISTISAAVLFNRYKNKRMNNFDTLPIYNDH